MEPLFVEKQIGKQDNLFKTVSTKEQGLGAHSSPDRLILCKQLSGNIIQVSRVALVPPLFFFTD